MFATTLLTTALLIPSAAPKDTPRDPTPTGPAPRVVELKPDADGKVRILVTRSWTIRRAQIIDMQSPPKIVLGHPGVWTIWRGDPVACPDDLGLQPFGIVPTFGTVPQSYFLEVATEHVDLANVKNLTVTTVDGKEVSREDALKKLVKGGVVIVSSDGNTVSKVYLKAFKNDMLVFVSPDLVSNDSTKAQAQWPVVEKADEPSKFAAIDAQTIAAYEKLGADFGGFRVDQSGAIVFSSGKEAAKKQLPGFRFALPDKKLPNLPPVQVPFGLALVEVKMMDGKELKDLTNLTMLDLSRTEFTDEALKEIKDLKSLTALDLYGMKMTDEGLKELKNFKNLTTLGLLATQVTDAGLKELKDLNNLAALVIGYTKITDAGLKDLKDLKGLNVLGLNYTKVSDVGLKELKGLKSLTKLDLSSTKVTDAGMKEIKGLQNLRELTLYNIQLMDAGMKELKELKNLTHLSLSSMRVTDAGLQELKVLKNLTRLDLPGMQITGVGLKDLKNLTTLWLRGTHVTDAGLMEIKDLKKLTELDLDNTNVTDAGIKELKDLKNLGALNLYRTKATITGVKELEKALPKCNILFQR